jgi:hypothetical protein
MTMRAGALAHAQRNLRATVGAVAVAAVAVVTTVVGTSTALAVDPEAAPQPSATPSPSPTPMGTVDDISATFDDYGPYFIRGGESVSATVTLTNSGMDPVGAVSVDLAITSEPLESRDEVAAFYDDPSSVATRVVKSVPAGTPELDEEDEPLDTGTITPRAAPSVRVTASSDDLALDAGTAGVYGMTASYTVGADTVLVNSMALTWIDNDIASLPVTSIATIAGQPSRVSSLIEGANIDGVSFVVDPSALSAATSLDALDGRELFVLPATHPDVASLAHAGDSALISFALDQARSRAWSSLAEAPWLAVSSVADRSVVGWADDAGALATLFEDDKASATPEVQNVDGWPAEVSTVSVSDDMTAPLIVPDAQMSDLVASFRPADPAGPSRIVAESALLAFDGDGTQGIVVSPGLSWIVGGDGPSQNLEALLSAPWVTPRTVAATLADPRRGEGKLPNAEGTTADVPVDHVNSLGARLGSLDRLSVTANYPKSVYVPGGRILLGAVSTQARGNPDRQAVAYTSSTTQVDATLAAVGVVQNSDVNLIAASGEVPITVHNDLGVDSTMTVVMRSSSPNLQVRDTPEVTVPAGGEITAMVPVEAVSTADVSITVWLENSKGDPVSDAQNFTMRVRADWGNAATAVFTALLVLVLIGGIIRTIRRGRKDTRTGPGAPAEGAKIVDGENHD